MMQFDKYFSTGSKPPSSQKIRDDPSLISTCESYLPQGLFRAERPSPGFSGKASTNPWEEKPSGDIGSGVFFFKFPEPCLMVF